METEIGFTLEYKFIPKDIRLEANGCAWNPKDIAIIFVDNTIGYGNICAPDYFQGCWYCSNHKDGSCLANQEPCLNPAISELNRVTLHELLHLCGCNEDQVRPIDRVIHPFKICSLFHDRSDIT